MPRKDGYNSAEAYGRLPPQTVWTVEQFYIEGEDLREEVQWQEEAGGGVTCRSTTGIQQDSGKITTTHICSSSKPKINIFVKIFLSGKLLLVTEWMEQCRNDVSWAQWKYSPKNNLTQGATQ